jgi:FkbM family methyltransferase
MLPEKFEFLKNRFLGDSENSVLHAACWDTDGTELPIFRANNGQSSSLFSPDLHLRTHPDVTFSKDGSIRTSRLETLLPKAARFDLINFDVQGAELRALRGLGGFLEQVKWAYLEVNERRLYDGCALLSEIDAFMQERGFVRIATRMESAHGWGDALFVNSNKLSQSALLWLQLKAAFWNTWANAQRDAPSWASSLKIRIKRKLLSYLGRE